MTVDMTKWLARKFPYAPPAGEFPMIVERLRGTPARIDAKLAVTPPNVLTRRIGEEVWSIQENIGHLLDLEPLWDRRLSELLEGKETLSEADLSNRATWSADHNGRSVVEIVAEFRSARAAFVERLDALNNDEVTRTSLHPRLKQPMRIVDLCLFVAEHDDHHLTMITELWRTLARARH
jgi:uncharacterized damage-inducible protein DinB